MIKYLYKKLLQNIERDYYTQYVTESLSSSYAIFSYNDVIGFMRWATLETSKL